MANVLSLHPAILRFWCLLSVFSLCFCSLVLPLELSDASDSAPPPPLPAPLEEISRPISLQTFWDGSVAARDTSTDEVIWSFSSGPPLSAYHGLLLEDEEETNATSGITGDPGIVDEKYIFCGTDWKLYSYDKRFGTEELPVSPDELVRNTPAVLDGAIVLGSFSTSAFLVDANSGALVREFGPGQSSVQADVQKTEDEESVIGRFQESQDIDYLLIVRKDYSISSVSTGSGAVLWNVSLGDLQLHYVKSDDIPRLPESKDAILDGVFLQNVDFIRGVKSTINASPPRLVSIPSIAETSRISLRPLVNLPGSKESEERNATPRRLVAMALPSADGNSDRLVPNLVNETVDRVLKEHTHPCKTALPPHTNLMQNGRKPVCKISDTFHAKETHNQRISRDETL